MWSGFPISLGTIQFVVIHKVKGFSLVNKAEVDIYLEFPCFFYDLTDVDSLVSGSFAFSKQLEHLEVLGSCTVEAYLEGFLALPYKRVR